MTSPDMLTLRKRLGLNQSEFAALLGISKTYVAHVETGIKPPPTRATGRLLAVLDVPGVVEKLRSL